jgi:ADP-ribose pyrophosphatase YjhB (NUDIX family)
MLVTLPEGHIEYQLPISIKGVAIQLGRVALLRNERDEWELPGGKLELGELPASCVAREIREELGWEVEVSEVLNVWVYEVRPDRHVFVATFGCLFEGSEEAKLSSEHREVGLFAEGEIDALSMPTPYKQAIHMWYGRSHTASKHEQDAKNA